MQSVFYFSSLKFHMALCAQELSTMMYRSKSNVTPTKSPTDVTSILTSSKMIHMFFCSTWHGISNAVYRFSMCCVVLDILRGGGGGEINPPAGARLAQTPAGARVNKFMFEFAKRDQPGQRHLKETSHLRYANLFEILIVMMYEK